MSRNFTPSEALERLYRTTYYYDFPRKEAYECLKQLIADYKLLYEFAERTLANARGENYETEDEHLDN